MRASCVLLVAFAACTEPSTVTVAPASPPAPDLGRRPADLSATPPPDLSAPPDDLTAPSPDLSAPPDDLAVPIADLASTTPPDLAQTLVDFAAAPDLRNPAGPWPVADITYYNLGAAIVDASTDEAHNLWAASRDTLYLLRPGAAPRKFTAADGLHIAPFANPWGGTSLSRITAIAGARADEVYVGYYGYESPGDRYADTEEQKALGQADRAVLGADGKLTVVRYQFRCNYGGSRCWENRSARRMVYAKTGVATGHVFMGFDHGVSHVFNDLIGDHAHVQVFYVDADAGTRGMKLGEQWGLYVMPDGQLWTASAYGVGLHGYHPVPPFSWVDAPWTDAFTLYSGNHALEVPTGYREDNRGVGVTPDGTVWFAGLRGLASWFPTNHNYTNVRKWLNDPFADLAPDPDGTVWLVTLDGALLRFDPQSGRAISWPGVSGVRRIVLDTTVTPRALYVSMDSGLAVIRAR
jgi:hypothetical protein